jgi:hypothetical protein
LDSNTLLQHFQNKRDLSWKQSTEESVKMSISKKLKATLNDREVPDDVKAKRYSHNLNSFMQTKFKLSDAPTIEELLDWKEEITLRIEEIPSRKNSKNLRIKRQKRAYKRANQEETAALRRYRLGAVSK